MRVIYLDADFVSATGETGPRSHAFARRLLARGHDVTMLTSDRQFELPEQSGRIRRTTLDGLDIVAVNVGFARRRSRVARLWHHLLFALFAGWFLLRCPRPDAVYATSPPLSVVLPLLAARWLRRVPYVLEVREIWPEVPRGIDAIRSRVLFLLLRRVALLGYRSASRIVALTEPAVHHIQADIPLSRKVLRIGSCCDLDLFGNADGSALRAREGWQDRFVCLYFGPLTRAAGLEDVLRVADAVREDEQFVFWFVGSGDHRAELERNIHDRDLRNVVLWDEVPRSQMPELLAAADLCLMTVRRFRVLEQANSDRLFDILAAGRPALLNYSGWQRDFVEAAGAGLGSALGDHGEFFEHICHLCDSPERREEMGRNARTLAETVCHPDRGAEQLEAVLSSVAGLDSAAKPDRQLTPG